MGIHDGKGRKRKKNGGNGEKWRKIEANGAQIDVNMRRCWILRDR